MYLNIHRNCIVSVCSNNSSSGRRQGSTNKIEEEDVEDNTTFGNEEDTVDYQYGEDDGSKNEKDCIQNFKRNYESSFSDVVMYGENNERTGNKEMSSMGDRGRSENESKKMKINNHDGDIDRTTGRDGINGSRSNKDGCASGSKSGNAHRNHNRNEDDRRSKEYSFDDMEHRTGTQTQNGIQNGIRDNSMSLVNYRVQGDGNLSSSSHDDMPHNKYRSHNEENFGSSSDPKQRVLQNRDFDSNILDDSHTIYSNNFESDARNINNENRHNTFIVNSSSSSNNSNSYNSNSSNGDYDPQHSHSDSQNKRNFPSRSHSDSHSQSIYSNNNNDDNDNDNDNNYSSNNRNNGNINCAQNLSLTSNSDVYVNQNRNRYIGERNDTQNNGNSDISSRDDNYNKTANSDKMTGERNTDFNENNYENRTNSVNQHALIKVTVDYHDNNIRLCNNINNDNNMIMRNDINSGNNNNNTNIAQHTQRAQGTDGNYSPYDIPETFFDSVKRTELPLTVTGMHRMDPTSSHCHGNTGQDASYFNTYSDGNTNANIDRNTVTKGNMNMNLSAKQSIVSSTQGEKVRFNYDNNGYRLTRNKVQNPDGTAADSAYVSSASTRTAGREGNSYAVNNQQQHHLYVNSSDTARKHAPIDTAIGYSGGNYEASPIFETTSCSAQNQAVTSMSVCTKNADLRVGAKKKKERSVD